jgi:hypothetical protein
MCETILLLALLAFKVRHKTIYNYILNLYTGKSESADGPIDNMYFT